MRIEAGLLAIALAATPARAADEGAAAQRVLQALRHGAGNPAGFTATYTVEERAGDRHRRTVYDMAYRRAPFAVRLVVRESDDLSPGLAVLDTGTGRVRVKLPGLMGMLPIEVPARSERSRDLLGLYPDQVTPAAFVRALLDPASRVRALGETAIDGQPVHLLEASGPACIVPGATLRLGLDATSLVPVYLHLTRTDGARLIQQYGHLVRRAIAPGELTLN